jgi:hypothetical protein
MQLGVRSDKLPVPRDLAVLLVPSITAGTESVSCLCLRVRCIQLTFQGQIFPYMDYSVQSLQHVLIFLLLNTFQFQGLVDTPDHDSHHSNTAWPKSAQSGPLRSVDP